MREDRKRREALKEEERQRELEEERIQEAKEVEMFYYMGCCVKQFVSSIRKQNAGD